MRKTWWILILLPLLACATPRRESKASLHFADGTSIEATTVETGNQLWLGERQDAVALPGVMAGGNVSKRTLGVTGGALGGAAIGALSGNPAMGALAGTVAGGLGQALEGLDTPTTVTLQGIR